MATANSAKGAELRPSTFSVGKEERPALEEDEVAQLAEEGLMFSSLHGFLIGDRNVQNSGVLPGVGLIHAPFSLLPSPFPLHLFQQALTLAPLFNHLTDAISMDAEFLQSTLRLAAKTDDFTRRLLHIHRKILEEGVVQDIRLGMHRSDYMLDMATGKLLQVELNTISSSFAGLSSVLTAMHRHFLESGSRGRGRSKTMETHRDWFDAEKVPENSSRVTMGAALAAAWKEYGDTSAVVLAVVQPVERNMNDQNLLWHDFPPNIRVLRHTLSHVHAHARLREDGALLLGEELVAVVYYRAGYSPSDYPSEAEWEVRLLMERSRAVKCPSISYHLAGTKKVQQELAAPGVLERFVSGPAEAGTLRDSFTGLWALDGDSQESQVAVEEAIAHPERFVLKPQREGGGNNIYGGDVRVKIEALRREGREALGAFVLMQRIFPPVQSAYLVRDGRCSWQETISELGIYSTYLRSGGKVVINSSAGHLLRTKTVSSDEGGVATGFAVLDTPYLLN